MLKLKSLDGVAIKTRIRILIVAILVGASLPTGLILFREHKESDNYAATTDFYLTFLARSHEIEREILKAQHNVHFLEHSPDEEEDRQVFRQIKSAILSIDQAFRSLRSLYQRFRHDPPAVFKKAEGQLQRIMRLQSDRFSWDDAASLSQTGALPPFLTSIQQLTRLEAAKHEAIMREIQHNDEQAQFFLLASLFGLMAVFSVAIVWITRSINQTLADQKSTREALSVSKNRLSEAQRIAHIGNWELTIATNELFWSDEACRIFGRNPLIFKPSYKAFVEAMHPEDRRRAIDAIEHAVANKEPYSVEHRIILPDGKERIVHEEGGATYAEDGTPTRLFGTVQDVTERRRAEETSARLGRILDASLNEIYIANAQTGNFVHVNDGALRNLGYTMEEMRGLKTWDINKVISEEKFNEMVEPLRNSAKHSLSFESVRLRKDGSSYPIEVHVQYFANENPPVFVSIVVDITDRKKAEEEAARFGRILEASLNEIFIFDAETCRFIDVNEGARRNLGYDLKELRGMSAWDIKSDYSEEEFRAMLEPLRTGEKGALKFETVHRRKDGSFYPVDVFLQLFSDDEKPVYVAMTLDISDRKQAVEDILALNRGLELSESRLSRAQEIAHIGNWEWNISRDNLYWSDEIFRIFGRDPKRFKPSYEAFLGTIHPDDRQKVQDAVDFAVANREIYSIEHRLVAADGEERVVHEQGEAEYDSDGNAIRMLGTVQDITDRKRAEERSNRFGRILEASLNEIFIFDADTCHFIDVNEGARRNLGYEMDELRGMTPWDIKPEFSEKEFLSMIAPLLNRKVGALKFETVHRRRDGSEYPVDVLLQLFADEKRPVFVAVSLDVTDRKKAEDTSARFGRILDTSVNEFYVFDAETLFIAHANETAIESTGYSMEELRGMAPYQLSGELSREKFQKNLAPLRTSERESVSFVTVRKRKDGGEYPIEVQIQYCGTENPPQFVATVLNIAERKKAEEKILELNRNLEKRVQERTRDLKEANLHLSATLDDLKQAQNQLVESEKMASLGGLVAGVAHEVNTPIGIGVTAASHLHEGVRELRDKYDRGDIKRSDLEDHLATAEQSTSIVLSNLQRASDLIRSFKQVAVDQSNEDLRRFDLNEYLDEIVTSLRPNLRKTNIEVAIECDEGLTVETFPGAVSQVVTNLIMNAIVHAYDDGQPGKLSLTVTDDGVGSVDMTFRDDGKGIPRENVSRIFDPFFTTRRGSGGSGLGLNIVYNLITRKLGGTITCSSEVGIGTTFEISFPKHVEDAHVGASEDRRAVV